jgi:hypothetical protein
MALLFAPLSYMKERYLIVDQLLQHGVRHIEMLSLAILGKKFAQQKQQQGLQ